MHDDPKVRQDLPLVDKIDEQTSYVPNTVIPAARNLLGDSNNLSAVHQLLEAPKDVKEVVSFELPKRQ